MLTHTHARLLVEGASCFGIILSPREIDYFMLYIEELQRWSNVANLVSLPDCEIVVRKHLLDSLAVVPLVPAIGPLLDLGSGAGFPGLVLAIMRPTQKVVLIEARRKRVSFLKAVARRVQASNVTVYEGRVERFVKEKALQSIFVAVLTRATWGIAEFLAFSSPFTAPGGLAFAMRGPEKRKTHTEELTKNSDFNLQHIHQYILPFGLEERRILMYKKLPKNVSHDT